MWLAGVWWEEGATFTESRARQAARESVVAGDICAVDTTRASNELLLSSSPSQPYHQAPPPPHLQPHCLSCSCVSEQLAGLDPADRLTYNPIHPLHNRQQHFPTQPAHRPPWITRRSRSSGPTSRTAMASACHGTPSPRPAWKPAVLSFPSAVSTPL
jgi:hypothetical protein